MPESSGLAGIVLAAGGSSRLGQPKQLLFVDGKTLVERAVGLAAEVCDAGVTLVVGAAATDIRESIDTTACRVLENPDWQAGLATSLLLALEHLRADVEGVLIMLCDQPRLQSADIAALATAWQNNPQQPAAAAFDGLLGAPAIVPTELIADLRAGLGGDAGAGQWLRQRQDVARVSLPAAAADLDTPADLEQLLADGVVCTHR